MSPGKEKKDIQKEKNKESELQLDLLYMCMNCGLKFADMKNLPDKCPRCGHCLLCEN